MDKNLIYKFVDKENKNQYTLLMMDKNLVIKKEDSNNNEIGFEEYEDISLYNIDYDILTMLNYCEPVYISMDCHFKLWELIGDLYLNGELDEYFEEIKEYIIFCKKNKLKYEKLKEESFLNIKNIYLISDIN